MIASTDDRRLSQGTDLSLSITPPTVGESKWSEESVVLMIHSRDSTYDERLDSDLSLASSGRLPVRGKDWRVENSQSDVSMNTISRSSSDERRAPVPLGSNRRPPVCERRWGKKYVQDTQTVNGRHFSYDERKLETSITRRDTISTVASSTTSINGLRRDDTIASDSSYSGTRGRMDSSNSIDDVFDSVSSSEKTLVETIQPVYDRLYRHGVSQTKKTVQKREEESSRKNRLKSTNRRRSNITCCSERLYNLSKEKQENGKKRREAIALAITKKNAIPKKEDFGVIPLSKASNMYNKGLKMLHEKNTKLQEAKIKLEGNNDFGTIPFDQSDNMYVKGVQGLRQKQFSIAKKQEMSHLKEMMTPETLVVETAPRPSPFLSDMERKYLLLQRGPLSARAIRDNSTKSLKAVTIREEIAQLIEIEVGEIGVKFSVESFEKLCRIATREV